MNSLTKNSFWNKFGAGPADTASTPALAIRAAGLCCAVGYNLDAAVCAMRANMDHFQRSDFKTGRHERVLVARLDDDNVWGQGRLARWIALAIADCLSTVGQCDVSKVPLVWLAPEPERSGSDSDWYASVFSQAVDQLGLQFHPRSGVMASGRAGLANALKQAAALLALPDCEQVLLVGADTYLNATTINAYLQAGRLQVRGNSDGFIPGEAAAAVLLQKAAVAAAGEPAPARHDGEVRILGFGTGDEPGRVDGSVPSKSQGLTAAIRAALTMSRLAFEDLAFRVSDQNGESFFAREASNAMTRLAPAGSNLPGLVTVADCLGEVGAATGPAMLAYLFKTMRHPAGPGAGGLLHLANDNGLRSAVILQRSIA
ncbi:hypothetical protein IV454_31480 [Massilia antarctica]|uniref:3-oxoacyl-[acyl-carrier-protein] synthase-1 n=1 Tax=Massilia antarctica TaxID=2765360 RepID=A0AA49A809_9BURK|nr:hypothetical protein [Massilia antarctica]QPI49879.1 hypothetical protein IV454_31480 [Massilia antarctica]